MALSLKGRLLLAVFVAMLLLCFSGCKKIAAAAGSRSALESLFEENILNRNFIVHLATQNSTNLTAQYAGYNFILTKNDSYYTGPLTATKAGVTYQGNWECNEDFGKLTIRLTGTNAPAEFAFLSRSWRFTSKSFPIMELAPWGSTEAMVLHMERL